MYRGKCLRRCIRKNPVMTALLAIVTSADFDLETYTAVVLFLRYALCTVLQLGTRVWWQGLRTWLLPVVVTSVALFALSLCARFVTWFTRYMVAESVIRRGMIPCVLVARILQGGTTARNCR